MYHPNQIVYDLVKKKLIFAYSNKNKTTHIIDTNNEILPVIPKGITKVQFLKHIQIHKTRDLFPDEQQFSELIAVYNPNNLAPGRIKENILSKELRKLKEWRDELLIRMHKDQRMLQTRNKMIDDFVDKYLGGSSFMKDL